MSPTISNTMTFQPGDLLMPGKRPAAAEPRPAPTGPCVLSVRIDWPRPAEHFVAAARPSRLRRRAEHLELRPEAFDADLPVEAWARAGELVAANLSSAPALGRTAVEVDVHVGWSRTTEARADATWMPWLGRRS